MEQEKKQLGFLVDSSMEYWILHMREYNSITIVRCLPLIQSDQTISFSCTRGDTHHPMPCTPAIVYPAHSMINYLLGFPFACNPSTAKWEFESQKIWMKRKPVRCSVRCSKSSDFHTSERINTCTLHTCGETTTMLACIASGNTNTNIPITVFAVWKIFNKYLWWRKTICTL